MDYRLVLVNDVDSKPAVILSTDGKVLQAMGVAFEERYAITGMYVSLIFQRQEEGEKWETISLDTCIEK